MVKFKYYHTGSTFNSSNLNNDDIAFVEATGSIWTHGHEYKTHVPIVTVMNISQNTTASSTIVGANNAGKQETVIYKNISNDTLAVTVDVNNGSPVTPTGQSITLACPAGGYVEVSYLNIGGTIYARGV